MTKPPVHTITLDSSGIGTRVLLETFTVLLWPLQPDARMTVLINLLADQTAEVAENDDQVDAIVEALRLRLKQRLAT